MASPMGSFKRQYSSDIRARVDDSGRKIQEKVVQLKGGLRKAVTGDPKKKIRDYMTEIPQVKLIDKLSFTFGVAAIAVTEFLALRYPSYVTQFYYLMMCGLITNRYFQYKEEKMEFFMFDFCYFMNASVMIQTALCPNCIFWFKVNYVLCMGSLMMAIIVWQNSLVFHSLDKLTSFFLHAFPPLTLHLYRWKLIPSEAIQLDDSLNFKEVFLWPMLFYSAWQLVYCFLIEVVFAETLRNDLELQTSVRYLANDKKNGMNKLVTKICLSAGIFSEGETPQGDELKTKLVFITSQVVYTIVTVLLTPFLYSSYSLSFAYIVSIYLWCVWRGGTYYIEVFSERYKLKFIKALPESVLTEGTEVYEYTTDWQEPHAEQCMVLSQEETKEEDAEETETNLSSLKYKISSIHITQQQTSVISSSTTREINSSTSREINSSSSSSSTSSSKSSVSSAFFQVGESSETTDGSIEILDTKLKQPIQLEPEDSEEDS